jgi:hypothetical protein
MEINFVAPNGKPYSPSPSQALFHTASEPFVYFSGGLGCASKDTEVIFKEGTGVYKLTLEKMYKRFNKIR